MARITLPEVHTGKTMLLLDRYQFIKGVMIVSNEEAKKMAPMLVRFYECSVEFDSVTVNSDQKESESDGSLTVASTKGLTASVTEEDLAKELAEFEAAKAKLAADEAAAKLAADEAAAKLAADAKTTSETKPPVKK